MCGDGCELAFVQKMDLSCPIDNVDEMLKCASLRCSPIDDVEYSV